MDNNSKLKLCFSKAFDLKIDFDYEKLRYTKYVDWDSITHMVLISEIEEEFSVSLSTDDIIALDSYDQALNIVSKYLSNLC